MGHDFGQNPSTGGSRQVGQPWKEGEAEDWPVLVWYTRHAYHNHTLRRNAKWTCISAMNTV
jgi:hypothetical protein